MRNQWPRAFLGFVWGILLFYAVAYSLRWSLGASVTQSPVVSQIVLKTALIVVALVGWKLLGEPYSQMGWRRAAWWDRSYLPWFLIAAASMAVASAAMILMDRRHPVASQLDFLQILLLIWLLSSFSEEVYVRGLIQSWMVDRDATEVVPPFHPAIVSSALVFAGMHVSLMWSPAGKKGGLAIVLATLSLGWACAAVRARSRSLLPAIACHVIGNCAGVPGGILGVIVYRLIYHRLPDFLSNG